MFVPASTFAYIFTIYVSVDVAELVIYGRLLD